MGAFLDVSKALFIPAAVAATLYALFTYLLLPFYRNHYARYRQYLPLSVNSSSNTRGLRTRFTDWLVNAMIPNSMRWGRDGDVVRYTSATDPDGTGARRGRDSFDSEVFVFGEEEGERLHLSTIDIDILILSLPSNWLSVAAMYDEAARVEALVRPYDSDTAYREYQAPRSSLCPGRENERYIEAVNEERFEVVVRLCPGFDFKEYNMAKVSLSIDGGCISSSGDFAKPKQRDCVSKVCKEIATCEDGKWRCVGFSFRELQALEGAPLTAKEEGLEALNRGRIEVTVQLGRRKRVAVDEGKSHGVATVPVDLEVTEKVKTAFQWTPASGSAGAEIKFTFFYASRRVLKLKNIIPTIRFAQDKRTEGDQASKGQAAQSYDDRQPCKATKPLLATTVSNLSQKPKEIISLDSDDDEQPPSKKIKTESIESIASTSPVSKTSAISTAKSSKDKRRARIESQLEDIRLQREENRLKRQMMDLDDEE
ncbi:hypothetical protein KC338_g6677 [Hortaea werneckii]|nr:hypothetical protein KC338_g6677 [Hortaea werneckii]